ERKQLPSVLAHVHRRFFTPDISIVMTAAVMMILTLKSSFVAALTISAIARLVTYAATCVALPVLRRRAGAPKALFRLPGGTIIAGLSLLLAAWLLMNSTLNEAIAATIAAAVGFAIYLAYRLTVSKKDA
ncbi:MAG TPA: hypothetical protein VLN44_02430, partial [Pyrinomonadaceae bacterium]|nr:hypothetical protein [Pyrinomonadaceae bacterium]